MRSHSPDWMNHLHNDDFTEISRLLHRRSVRTTYKKFLYNHLYRRFVYKNSVRLHVYILLLPESIVKGAVFRKYFWVIRVNSSMTLNENKLL